MNVAAQVAARQDWPAQSRGPFPAGEPGPPAATFPQGPRQVLVELFLAGGWVDVTSYVYSRDPVSISRGLSAEAGVTDPATLSLTLNNRSGRFSARNPTGPYYGQLTRNTPIRVKAAGYYAAGWRGRFHGEVSSWPQKWDPSGADAWVPLEAAGVLRRLGQGETALRSTLYRRLTRLATPPVGYWPCEDAAGATSVASATGGTPMVVTGSPSYAASDAFACAGPILTVESAKLVGTVPAYPSVAQVQLRFLLGVPAAGTTNNAVLARLYAGGSLPIWDVLYTTGGGFLTLKAYRADGTLVLTSSGLGFVDGRTIRVSVEVSSVRDPTEVDYALRLVDTAGITTASGSVSAATVDRSGGVIINPALAGLSGVAVGHVAIQREELTPGFEAVQTAYLFDELTGYAGETAGQRLLRLSAEEGLPVRVVGDPAGTAAMGAQRPDTLLALLRECATTDAGLLYEPRDEAGLAYRTRESLYNRAAGLTVDYPSHQLSALDPVDDDRYTRNDVTVTRRSGSSARAVQESGPLSVRPPPDGAGRYTQETEVNSQTDTALPDHAGWRLHLGTVDEPRYPAVTLDLASPALANSQALSEAVLDADVGSRLVVTHPPAWLPPDDISAGVQGITETINTFEHTITVSCAPESPYHIGVYDQAESRYSSDGSTLFADVDAVATSLLVGESTGPLWSHADGDFDILVGGERMTVTAVTGSSSPQTFTVVRSVNGVVKAHQPTDLTGPVTVELFRPVHYSI